jgi:hypothetical protein
VGREPDVIAAEQHATPPGVPAGQRIPVTRWSAHKDIAATADDLDEACGQLASRVLQ